MTLLGVTAGLCVQDTLTPPASATAAWLTAGLAAADLPHVGYELYYSLSAAAIDPDTDTPAALIPAGQATEAVGDLGLVADTDYWFALFTRSAPDRLSSASNLARVRISAGSLVGPPPNPLTGASARAIAGGKVTVGITYNTAKAPAAATSLQVALMTAGVYNWAVPAATVAIGSSETGSLRKTVTLGETFDSGRLVQLAARAVAADGVSGPVTVMIPVTADATAPAAIPSGLLAEQYDE